MKFSNPCIGDWTSTRLEIYADLYFKHRYGDPISRVYSEKNCVRDRAGGRGRGRNRGRDNHDLGDPSKNSSVNRSLRQHYPVLGNQVHAT